MRSSLVVGATRGMSARPFESHAARRSPASPHARPISRDSSMLGKPPIRYGISAARLPCDRNASAIRVSPATAGSLDTKHLGQVLVAAARERDEVDGGAFRVLEQPSER